VTIVVTMGCAFSHADRDDFVHVTVLKEFEARPPKDPLRFNEEDAALEAERMTLDDVLRDTFAQGYLLRFAHAEFSSENITFLLKLRAMLENTPRSETGQLLTRSHELIKQHVAPGAILEVQTTPSLQQHLCRWLKESMADHTLLPPMDEWDKAYKLATRQVKFDILPRFRRSRACLEYVTLHLRRCALSPLFREAFAGGTSESAVLVPIQRNALNFYLAAMDFEAKYVGLASGWPSEATVQSAKRIFYAYSKCWGDLHLDADVHTHIQRQLPEAPATLFVPVLYHALNCLEATYESWLDTAAAARFCKEHIGISRIPKPKMADAVGDDIDEYAW